MLKGFLNKIALATVVIGSLFIAACSSSSSSSSGGGGSAPGVVTAIVRSAASGANGAKVIEIYASKELTGLAGIAGLAGTTPGNFRNATDDTLRYGKRYVVSLMDTTAGTPVIISTIVAATDTAPSPVSKLTITTASDLIAGNKYSLSIRDTKGKYVVTVPNFAGTLAGATAVAAPTIGATATTPMDPKTAKGVYTITATMVNTPASTTLATVRAFNAYIVDAGGELVALPAFTVEATDTSPTPSTHASASILTWENVTLTDGNQYFLVLGDSSGKYTFAPGAITSASLTKTGTRTVKIENITNNGFTLSFDKPVSGLRGDRFMTTLEAVDEKGTSFTPPLIVDKWVDGSTDDGYILQEPVANMKLTFVATPANLFSGKVELTFHDTSGLISAIDTVSTPSVDISGGATTIVIPKTDITLSAATKPAPTADTFYIALSPYVVPMCDLVGTQECELYPATATDAEITAGTGKIGNVDFYVDPSHGLEVHKTNGAFAASVKFVVKYSGITPVQALTTFAPSPLVINLPKRLAVFTWGLPPHNIGSVGTWTIPVIKKGAAIPSSGIKGVSFPCNVHTIRLGGGSGTDVSGSTCAFNAAGDAVVVTFKNATPAAVNVAPGDILTMELKPSVVNPQGADLFALKATGGLTVVN